MLRQSFTAANAARPNLRIVQVDTLRVRNANSPQNQFAHLTFNPRVSFHSQVLSATINFLHHLNNRLNQNNRTHQSASFTLSGTPSPLPARWLHPLSLFSYQMLASTLTTDRWSIYCKVYVPGVLVRLSLYPRPKT